MSFPETTSEQFFTGNGVLTSFSYGQNVPTASASQIRVTLFDTATGSEVVLVNGTHYTLTGVGGSGGINVEYPIGTSPIPFDQPVTSAQQLLVEIVPVQNQQIVIKHGDTFDPTVTEEEWDRQTRMIQNLQDASDRSFKVARGQPAPVDGVTVNLTGQKVLLDSNLNFSGTELDMVFENWPLFYDSIELEFIRARPNVNGAFELNPIDNGSVITTNIGVVRQFVIGTFLLNEASSDWLMSDVDNTAEAQMVGSIVFFNAGGSMAGNGRLNQGSAGGFGGCRYYFKRSALATRLDGIRITHENGIFSCAVRLWGLPRT